MTSIRCAGHTHPGRIRDRNEDAWACHDRIPLAVVADGMGGHPAGHVASRIAVDAVLESLTTTADGDVPSVDSRPHPEEWGENRGDRMAEAVRSANRRILARGEERPAERGMGTTLTALQVDPSGDRYLIGHVGDSRAYLFRDGSLTPLTRDDSPLQERVDQGLMTREEARTHPMGNVLSQALGTQPEVSPQIVDGSARPGDLFLLCSDGLIAVLSESRIEEILNEARVGTDAGRSAEDDPEARLETVAVRLTEEVLDGGAPDNVTVVLVEVVSKE